jgi:hypothetical protein
MDAFKEEIKLMSLNSSQKDHNKIKKAATRET